MARGGFKTTKTSEGSYEETRGTNSSVHDDKRQRKMMMMIQGGVVRLRIEMGRWRNIRREQCICRHCGRGEVEDVVHWFLYCSDTTWWGDDLKSRWCRSMGGEEMSDEEKVVDMLDRGSIDRELRQMIEKLWEARFG